jgi:hypothetical protein
MLGVLEINKDLIVFFYGNVIGNVADFLSENGEAIKTFKI